MSDRTHVKLCGLRTPREAEVAAEIGAGFIGLMFAEKSKRRISVEEARRILAVLGRRPEPARLLLHEGIPPGLWFQRCAAAFDALIDRSRPLVVGVFADQPPALVNAIADTLSLDAVQLSGHEPLEQALEIRRPVIKAIHVDPEMTAEAALAACEAGTAAVCLLDTALAGALGGTGRTFDWGIAAAFAAQLPCMLAGGLTPENVGGALGAVRPWAVDVSSGIETSGEKDEAKMRAFVQAVREAGTGTARSPRNQE